MLVLVLGMICILWVQKASSAPKWTPLAPSGPLVDDLDFSTDFGLMVTTDRDDGNGTTCYPLDKPGLRNNYNSNTSDFGKFFFFNNSGNGNISDYKFNKNCGFPSFGSYEIENTDSCPLWMKTANRAIALLGLACFVWILHKLWKKQKKNLTQPFWHLVLYRKPAKIDICPPKEHPERKSQLVRFSSDETDDDRVKTSHDTVTLHIDSKISRKCRNDPQAHISASPVPLTDPFPCPPLELENSEHTHYVMAKECTPPNHLEFEWSQNLHDIAEVLKPNSQPDHDSVLQTQHPEISDNSRDEKGPPRSEIPDDSTDVTLVIAFSSIPENSPMFDLEPWPTAQTATEDEVYAAKISAGRPVVVTVEPPVPKIVDTRKKLEYDVGAEREPLDDINPAWKSEPDDLPDMTDDIVFPSIPELNSPIFDLEPWPPAQTTPIRVEGAAEKISAGKPVVVPAEPTAHKMAIADIRENLEPKPRWYDVGVEKRALKPLDVNPAWKSDLKTFVEHYKAWTPNWTGPNVPVKKVERKPPVDCAPKWNSDLKEFVVKYKDWTPNWTSGAIVKGKVRGSGRPKKNVSFSEDVEVKRIYFGRTKFPFVPKVFRKREKVRVIESIYPLKGDADGTPFQHLKLTELQSHLLLY